MSKDEFGYIEGTDYASAHLADVISNYVKWIRKECGREPTQEEIEMMLKEEGAFHE